MDPRHRRPAAVLGWALLSPLLVTACSSGSTTEEVSGAAAGADSTAGATASAMSQEVVALTAAACVEITRITREEMGGLINDDPADWERFAVSLQSLANGSVDPAFGASMTTMASSALRTAEALAAGKPLGPALTAFEDTIPAVDSACKKVAAPLN
jgi:hypothetical protein